MLPTAQRKTLKFDPPKPTMIEGIKDLILLFKKQFTEVKFRDCVNRTFIKTGILPVNFTDSRDAEFIKYKKESLFGTMKDVPEGNLNLDEEEQCIINDKDKVLLNDRESLERGVINYYIDNLEAVAEEIDSDGSDSESE